VHIAVGRAIGRQCTQSGSQCCPCARAPHSRMYGTIYIVAMAELVGIAGARCTQTSVLIDEKGEERNHSCAGGGE